MDDENRWVTLLRLVNGKQRQKHLGQKNKFSMNNLPITTHERPSFCHSVFLPFLASGLGNKARSRKGSPTMCQVAQPRSLFRRGLTITQLSSVLLMHIQ